MWKIEDLEGESWVVVLNCYMAPGKSFSFFEFIGKLRGGW